MDNKKLKSFKSEKIYKVIASLDNKSKKEFIKYVNAKIILLEENVFSFMKFALSPSYKNCSNQFLISHFKVKSEYINEKKHKLLLALDEYICLKKIKSNKLNYRYLLLEYYNENNIPLFVSKVKKIKSQNISFYENYMISKVKLNFTKKTEVRKSTDDVNEAFDELDSWYYLEYFQLLCEGLSRDVYFNSKENINKRIKPLNQLKKTFDSSPIHYFYILLIEYFLSPADKKYEICKAYIINNLEFIQNSEYCKSLLILYRSVIVHIYNKEFDIKYARDYIALIESQIKNTVHSILENNFLDPSLFKNIIKMYLKLNMTKKANSFLANFKNYINPLHANILEIAQAEIYITSKMFDEAHSVITNIVSKDLLVRLSIYKLKIIIYFEQQYLELAESTIKQLEKYISSNKKNINIEICNKYFILLKYFRKLLINNPNKIEKIRNKIKAELKDDKTVLERDWFLSKL